MKDKYDHKEIEKKWQDKWQEQNLYKTSDTLKGPKTYVLDMFPYPSGDGLHVGHPKGYIATDIYSRMKKSQGFNILHPMGFDAFGLPAENYAIKNKIHPRIAVEKNIKRFKEQLEKIGFNYDWGREINTTDPEFYKWTQWIFLKFLEKGLAYESFEPINWCPSCQTGLANEDLENGVCERCGSTVEKRSMRQWVLRITDYAERLLSDLDKLNWPEYIKESQRNWIGKSEGAEVEFKINPSTDGDNYKINVFTTRIDTLFGVTYVVVAPEYEWLISQIKNPKSAITNKTEIEKYIKETRNKTEIERTDAKKDKTGVEIKGIKAINPANGEEVPVFVADYVLNNYGTGAVMAVPAHDERDFAFAQKYNLPIKQVIAPYFSDPANPFKPEKKVVFRKVVHSIIINPKNNKILCLEWKNFPWNTFIIGGIEEGETNLEAALREIKEETGYKNLKFIKKLAGPFVNEFYAAHKDINRIAQVDLLLFELENEEVEPISEEENSKHKVVWVEKSELRNFIKGIDEKDYEIEAFERGEEKCFVGEGVLVNSPDFELVKSEEAREKIAEKFGKKVVKYKLRDWVFSRQRYWGEPIPIIHCDKCGTVAVPEKDLPVRLPEVEHYEPTGTGESPLANIKEWVNTACPKCGGPAKRETNTMPQWAGSSWYYLRYIDPKNSEKLVDKEKEKYWSPVDVYVGGAEHATRHLIYARFWHKFLFDLGIINYSEPFTRFQNVGLILAEDGKKMSKRFGNVINPDNIVEVWGADSLRLYEMFMGPFNQEISWKTDNMIGVRRFLERVWKQAKKIGDQDLKEESRKEKSDSTASDSKIESLLHKTIKKITNDIENFDFNTAISSLMIFTNEVDKADKIIKEDYETFLKLLAPFAPHIAEEMWHELEHSTSIHLEAWPKFEESKIRQERVVIGIQINGKIRAQFEAEAGIKEDEVKEKALALPEVQKWLTGQEVRKVVFIPNKILNFVV